jgi:hypothetical protein
VSQTTRPDAGVLRDRLVLVVLFVALRLTLLAAHQPIIGVLTEGGAFLHGDQGVEVGITNYGDFRVYYQFAKLADQNLLPYRDYWFGYPPLFPVINTAVYRISLAFGGGYNPYATLMSLVMIACDAGTLLMLLRVGFALHGAATGMALGWIYALLGAPVVFGFWDVEPMVAFFVMLALSLLVAARNAWAGLAIAGGALVKVVPLVLLGAVWRFRPRGAALRVTLISLGITALVLGALAVAWPRFTVPSLLAQAGKSSHETVWALLDGNYRTGNLDPDPFDPATATRLQGLPPRVPPWARALLFAGIGAWLFLRTRRRDAEALVAFATLTVLTFFLWSQAWSPQWQVIVTPLLLLCFPSRTGAFLCVALAAINFLEFPILFTRYVDETRSLRAEARPLFIALVLTRTALFAGTAWVLARRLASDKPVAKAATAATAAR